ncbi:MAG: pilin [bacterium]|nr:pilin [bacterium]
MNKLALTLPGEFDVEIPVPTVGAGSPTPNGLLQQGDLNMGTIINSLLPLVFWFAGILLFVYLIYGGYKMLTSMGDEGAIEEAKGTITNAILGIAIVFVAYFVAQWMASVFGINDLFTPAP